MNDVPPGNPLAITLRRRTSTALFQSPFGAEPVTVGHQPLDGDARQLLEAVEVLERVGECAEPACGQESPQAHLDPGSLA